MNTRRPLAGPKNDIFTYHLTMKKFFVHAFTILSVVIALQSCTKDRFRSNYQDHNRLIHETKNLLDKPFLKAHLKNGDICILYDSWKIDTIAHNVNGYGTRFNFNRSLIHEGKITLPIDRVAIFETNKRVEFSESGRIAVLTILAGFDLYIGIYCMLNPKACFGSCPTFYINENDNFHYADAEGFSSAISPSMEYYDVDALNHHTLADSNFSITMKNEALETHCVKEVKLLAYPLNKGERVYHSAINDFYLCENNYPLSEAKANEGDITWLLKDHDRQERFSLADEKNLSSKEEIYLTFNDVKNPSDLGLILQFRQSLLTTYIFYSAMGYMGEEVSDIFAKIETDEEIREKALTGIMDELGNIDIYVWDGQTEAWVYQNEFNETGPIAINRQFIPLKIPLPEPVIKVKIVLNKGLWRMDYVALTNIKKEVTVNEFTVNQVLNKGKEDSTALGQLIDPEKYLISMPGSKYKFSFPLPGADTTYELFLFSKGYYLEWMREKWIKDKNLMKLKQMVDRPKKYLRQQSKDYKQYEATMEEQFWNSKIETETFLYYEK
ncbi:MAG: hypothetical protein WD077_01895 [Bacteroidia bacterium]